MLENKKVMVPKIGEEVHYSRIIASWHNCWQDIIGCRRSFKDWLRYLGIEEQAISEISEMEDCGKMELESSVHTFVNFKNQNDIW